MSPRFERRSTLLLAARQSPDFAVRWLASLDTESRAELLGRWSASAPVAPPPAAPALRLRKCSPSTPAATPLGAQLEAFARSVRRVG
jgi:hypothetical protein